MLHRSTALTYASAGCCRFDQHDLGRTWAVERFVNTLWRRLVEAFEESGMTEAQLAACLDWDKRKVRRCLQSPAGIRQRGMVIVAELAWALDTTIEVKLEKINR